MPRQDPRDELSRDYLGPFVTMILGVAAFLMLVALCS